MLGCEGRCREVLGEVWGLWRSVVRNVLKFPMPPPTLFHIFHTPTHFPTPPHFFTHPTSPHTLSHTSFSLLHTHPLHSSFPFSTHPTLFHIKRIRAGARTVDLGRPSVHQGGQSLKLSTKAAVFKRVSLLIGEAKHVDWGNQAPLGVGPEAHVVQTL